MTSSVISNVEEGITPLGFTTSLVFCLAVFVLILLRPIATETKVMQRVMKMHRCVTDHLLDVCERRWYWMQKETSGRESFGM